MKWFLTLILNLLVTSPLTEFFTKIKDVFLNEKIWVAYGHPPSCLGPSGHLGPILSGSIQKSTYYINSLSFKFQPSSSLNR